MSAASTPGKMVHRALMGTILVGYRDESIFHCGLGLRHGNALDEQEQNARRLVAAWNATDGVPTEVMESAAAGGLPWRFTDQLDLLADRDRLLAALVAYEKWADPTVCKDAELAALREQIRTAIAKSKGVNHV